eukprot:CAMPEP_0176085516 /NCGR_PEP_ID=MMETSP0120_2-20121206/42800_1 /TAXON_ID=160619 /ORGANISM="Kryptoperidinium foliaceum, Strain CCMP 1326" /LENGTH=61 /DNA_ID=CAMNT_0017419333 /DNA_START=475 /DNA_END=660 /DNA_ORIENTATION=-
MAHEGVGGQPGRLLHFVERVPLRPILKSQRAGLVYRHAVTEARVRRTVPSSFGQGDGPCER